LSQLFVNKDNALHLEKILQDHYPVKSDWKGERYIEIDLKWNYEKQTLKTSMDGYAKKALLQFQHEMPKQQYSAPSKYNIPQYGAKQKLTQIATSEPM